MLYRFTEVKDRSLAQEACSLNFDSMGDNVRQLGKQIHERRSETAVTANA